MVSSLCSLTCFFFVSILFSLSLLPPNLTTNSSPASMDLKLCLHHRVGVPVNRVHWRTASNKKISSRVSRVQAVLTRPRDDTIRVNDQAVTTHNDNWFDMLAINYLSQSFQDTTGVKNGKIGYESLMDAAAVVSHKFNTRQQQELVVQTLKNAVPEPILLMIRTLMRPSKFTREYFAVFTTIFFPWLVGPCEVKESEVEGRMEKNIVHIKKCRFLEGTRCVGQCVNLCKMPSQRFIKDSLGVPLNMVPNFEDMSCDMIFGQDPPAPSDDPALKQPCYKFLCKAKQNHTSDCSN